MSIYNLDRSKIRPEHHERAAFVYIRQSSLKQVRENLESQKRQYGFAEQARAMGWNEQQVVVVDEDQGKSGATPEARPGFARLISAVARSEVGIVMSLEVSRLSRNDADWYHLVHLCRWTGTLIADEQGIYDPSAGADRISSAHGVDRDLCRPTGSREGMDAAVGRGVLPGGDHNRMRGRMLDGDGHARHQVSVEAQGAQAGLDGTGEAGRM